ncbi:MAG: tetraacyldisaccharide 4'-kinase [candidate division Zixibacteria bacterium]|nr:tetraacyldisaccharide 4'-kinase [candidate division Zixibacteria bacterium]
MKNSFGLTVQDYLNNPQQSALTNIVSILLLPFSLIYAFVMIVRRQLYEMGVFRSKRFDHPVISVGNLTTGGTGKTPFEIYLVELMRDMDLKPLILSRGYGSKSSGMNVVRGNDNEESDKIPDEVSMIAEIYPDLPIAFGTNRYKAYQQAAKQYDFDLVILDDGFQHLKIRRDLDILILDAACPFGSGRLLPSGNLREPGSMLRYADLAVLNLKSDSKKVENWQGLTGRYAVTDIISFNSNEKMEPSDFAGKNCAMITAIGDANSFQSLLKKQNLKISRAFRFRDHHDYTEEDLKDVREMCISDGIERLFTTEKDAVKLKRICFENPPVYVIKIAFRLENGEDELKQRIRALARK